MADEVIVSSNVELPWRCRDGESKHSVTFVALSAFEFRMGYDLPEKEVYEYYELPIRFVPEDIYMLASGINVQFGRQRTEFVPTMALLEELCRSYVVACRCSDAR